MSNRPPHPFDEGAIEAEVLRRKEIKPRTSWTRGDRPPVPKDQRYFDADAELARRYASSESPEVGPIVVPGLSTDEAARFFEAMAGAQPHVTFHEKFGEEWQAGEAKPRPEPEPVGLYESLVEAFSDKDHARLWCGQAMISFGLLTIMSVTFGQVLTWFFMAVWLLGTGVWVAIQGEI